MNRSSDANHGSGFAVGLPADGIDEIGFELPDFHAGGIGQCRARAPRGREIVGIGDPGTVDNGGNRPAARQFAYLHGRLGNRSQRPQGRAANHVIHGHTLRKSPFIAQIRVAHRLGHRPPIRQEIEFQSQFRRRR